MAKGVNKVFLLGNVGKDPEIRSTAGGMTIASFSLATADRQKDAQGNWADKTEWHNIVCFQRTAEVVRDYVKKGTQLFIEGKIQTRSWDDKTSGEKKYKTEILCNELTLLGGKARRRRSLRRRLLQISHHQLRPAHSRQPGRLLRRRHHRRRHPFLGPSFLIKSASIGWTSGFSRCFCNALAAIFPSHRHQFVSASNAIN